MFDDILNSNDFQRDLANNGSNSIEDSNLYLNSSDPISSNFTPDNSALSSPFDSIIGETGSAMLNHNQKTIDFDGEYENPVVFATSVSHNGGDPAMVRFTDITGTDFKAFLEEPNYLAPGTHTNEQFSYVVLEAGSYELENGALIEVGKIDSNATVKREWENIEFESEFTDTPIVLSQVQSHKGSDFVRTRMKNITEDGFALSMEEEEKLMASAHAEEAIGYLAMSEGSGEWGELTYEAGTTGDSITHNKRWIKFDGDFSTKPNFMAGVASYDGADPVGVRQIFINANGVSLKLEEDKSKDSETKHTHETVNFLALSGDGFLKGAASDDLVTPEVTDLQKYWYYYNYKDGEWSDTDSYQGSVIAPAGTYTVNQTYDFTSDNNEIGSNGTYSITAVEDYDDSLTSEVGRVFVDTYTDRDNGEVREFIPYLYRNGVQPAGTNYLGSEIDYIEENGSVIGKFGQDYYEADYEPITENDWKAEYFNNTNLSGSPIFTQNLGDGTQNLSLNWGSGSPQDVVDDDNFSAIITTKRDLEPGWYQIQTGSDDGIRVTIDRRVVIDSWLDRGFIENDDSAHFYFDGGETDIKIEYYEKAGGAALDFKLQESDGLPYGTYDPSDLIEHRVDLEQTSWDWNIEQVGDFNGDGIDDVMIRRYDGRVHAWLLDTNAQINHRVDLEHTSWDWNVEQVGDFNGDGIDDVLIRRYDGRVHAWLLDSNAQINHRVDLEHTSWDWNVEQVGDFNGDGIDDVMIRRYDGRVHAWLLDSNAQINHRVDLEQTSWDWNIEQVGDFNEDGITDVLNRRYDGQIHAWLLDSNAQINHRVDLEHTSFDWNIKQVGDFNGDGTSDIMNRRYDGNVHAWILKDGFTLEEGNDGNTFNSATSLNIGSTVTGLINNSDKNDYYKFTLNETKSISITVNGMKPTETFDADVDVKLFDSNQQEIDRSENPYNNSESINRSLNPGTYYIHAYQGRPDETNSQYNLTLSVSDTNGGGSYYPGLADWSNTQWDWAAGDNTRITGAYWSGESDETNYANHDKILQIYNDLSRVILGEAYNSSAGYVQDLSYFNGPGQTWGYHNGIDIDTPNWTPTSVKALVGGIASIVQNTPGDYFLEVAGDDGRYYWYGHLSSLNITSGRVNVGDMIGELGMSEASNHLHFQVNETKYRPSGYSAWNKNDVYAWTMNPLKVFWELRNESGGTGDITGFDISAVMSAVPTNYRNSTTQSNLTKILNVASEAGLSEAQTAYVLATVQHETAHTFQPVSEAYWQDDPNTAIDEADIYLRDTYPYSRYYPYYGRGYVQLTWKSNYEKMSNIVGVDLVNNKELAKDPDIAAKILVYGMRDGHFTNKKLSDYINESNIDFTGARWIVNGTDKASLIAGYADNYYNALT